MKVRVLCQTSLQSRRTSNTLGPTAESHERETGHTRAASCHRAGWWEPGGARDRSAVGAAQRRSTTGERGPGLYLDSGGGSGGSLSAGPGKDVELRSHGPACGSLVFRSGVGRLAGSRHLRRTRVGRADCIRYPSASDAGNQGTTHRNRCSAPEPGDHHRRLCLVGGDGR